MRRALAATVLSMTLALVAALLVPAAVLPAGSRADAAAQMSRPPVKRVVRAYGEGPVVLAPRQFAAVTFTARRGHEVSLDVHAKGGGRCWGDLTLKDGRGSRTKELDRVFRVRANGKAVIWFRGRCRPWGLAKPSASIAQLVKVRSREVEMDGRSVRVGRSNERFVEVAWVKVPRTGRVKLTGRDARGKRMNSNLVLEGDWLRPFHGAEGASGEHGQPPMFDLEPDEDDRPLRRGGRIGLAFARGPAWVEARSALQHTVELDGPPVTLESGQGREHVLSVQIPAGTHTYLDWGTPSEFGWGNHYWLEPEGRFTTEDGVYRLVVSSMDNAELSSERTLRIRSIVELPDLVVNGAPVRFESTDPGQWFRSTVPAVAPGPVRFEASEVAVTGDWMAGVQPPCYRDCIGGAVIRSGEPVEPGSLPYDEPNAVYFKFDHGATGGVSLRLVR